MPRKRQGGPLFDEKSVDIAFPLEGLDITGAFMKQRPLTSVQAINVRGFDPTTDRARGGSRPGLLPYANGPGNAIQDMTIFVSELAVTGGIVAAGPGIPGTSTNTVTVANPGSQANNVGTAISTLTLSSTDTRSTPTFTWTQQGLPAGLSLNSSTGHITGTPTVVQSCTVVVTATDQDGSFGTATFTWIIQTTQTTRTQDIVFVSNGTINVVNGSSYTAIAYHAGQTALSTTAPVIFGAALQQQLFYSDGSKYQLFAPWALSGAGQIQAWTPTTGTLPIDTNNNTGTLMETWGGRIIIGGLLDDGANWFQSAQLDPFNWNYSPQTQVSTQAVAGNDAMPGTLGDLLRSIAPYNSSLLVYGYSHSLWLQTGDLGAGGQITNVSQSLGMQWGRPYCIDPFNQMYFVGSDRGVYKYVPGSLPVWISQAINRDLQNLTPYDPQVGNTGVIFRMVWDMYNRGLWLFTTQIGGSGAQHWFWEERTNAWWPQKFGNSGYDPFAVAAAGLDTADQQTLLIGGQDGVIRAFSDTASTDTGAAIASSVVIGPIAEKRLPAGEAILLKELVPWLSDESGPVTWAVYAGPTAESALAAAPLATGTWQSGRNPAPSVRVAGLLVYVKLSATGPWAMERLRAIVAPLGRVATRAYYAVPPPAIPPKPLGVVVSIQDVHVRARKRRVLVKRRVGVGGQVGPVFGGG